MHNLLLACVKHCLGADDAASFVGDDLQKTESWQHLKSYLYLSFVDTSTTYDLNIYLQQWVVGHPSRWLKYKRQQKIVVREKTCVGVKLNRGSRNQELRQPVTIDWVPQSIVLFLNFDLGGCNDSLLLAFLVFMTTLYFRCPSHRVCNLKIS